MPAYHFIFHAYRSWNTDHPDGYRNRGIQGVLPANNRLALARSRQANFAPVLFSPTQRRLLLEHARFINAIAGQRLHAAVATPTHLHIVVSWDDPRPPEEVWPVIKRKLGRWLAEIQRTRGRPYFSRGASETRIKNRRHLNELVYNYLASQGGDFWSETPPSQRGSAASADAVPMPAHEP